MRPTAGIYIANGAKFVVGPMTNAEVARLCNRRGDGLFARAAARPARSARPRSWASEIVKVFPADRSGGPDFVKNILGPMPWTKIMPTGGVEATEESLKAWFGAGIVACGIGSNLVTKALLDAQDYDGIEKRVRDTVRSSRKIKGANDGGDVLKIRPASECRWDCAAFGEVMLRFDPGFGAVRNARTFQVWEGGGEYNVARAMRKCWGKRATHVTALPKNDLGWLVEDHMMQGGVDTSHLIWREFDGIGRETRVGLNFTEKGFGLRPGPGRLGPRQFGGLADPAGRGELGEAVRRGGRALVPHRRHLRRARAPTPPRR
jgi:hypothetical protein